MVHAVREGEVEEPTPGLTTKLMNNYLLVSGTDEQKFKLKPIKDDHDSYSKLFGSPAPLTPAPRYDIKHTARQCAGFSISR